MDTQVQEATPETGNDEKLSFQEQVRRCLNNKGQGSLTLAANGMALVVTGDAVKDSVYELIDTFGSSWDWDEFSAQVRTLCVTGESYAKHMATANVVRQPYVARTAGSKQSWKTIKKAVDALYQHNPSLLVGLELVIKEAIVAPRKTMSYDAAADVIKSLILVAEVEKSDEQRQVDAERWCATLPKRADEVKERFADLTEISEKSLLAMDTLISALTEARNKFTK